VTPVRRELDDQVVGHDVGSGYDGDGGDRRRPVEQTSNPLMRRHTSAGAT
jgi:hypothetical protein